MVYRGSTAYHGVNLVLDLDVKVLNDLAFLYNSSLFLSVFVSQLLLMYHCVKIVQIRSFFWSLFFCIWAEYQKDGAEKTPQSYY